MKNECHSVTKLTRNTAPNYCCIESGRKVRDHREMLKEMQYNMLHLVIYLERMTFSVGVSWHHSHSKYCTQIEMHFSL